MVFPHMPNHPKTLPIRNQGESRFRSTGNRFRAAVLYFQGSLSGLQVGSPVTFRGVRVAAPASRLSSTTTVQAQKLTIPIFIEINPDDFQIVHGTRGETNIDELVQRGLRA
jgi:paraquat-inducible protein B